MNAIYLLLPILIVVALYAISLYNWFKTAETRLKASIQEIGNQLKRQADLIPNLESSTKGYLKHEKGIFDEITSARKSVDSALKSKNVSEMADASSAIGNLLPKLQVLVESNPEMKGVEVVTRLMDELRDTSDKLLYSRRVLIDLTADYNQKLAVFPSNIVGNMFGFKEQAGLETPLSGEHVTVSESETKSPKVNL